MKSGFIISTRTQLYLGAGTILTCVIVVIIAGLIGTQKIDNIYKRVGESQNITQKLTEMKADQNRNQSHLLELIGTVDATHKVALEKEIQVQSDKIAQLYSDLDKFLFSYPEIHPQYRQLEEMFSSFRKNREQQISLINEGKSAEALARLETIQVSLYEEIRGIIDNIQHYLENHTRALSEEADAIDRMARVFIWIPGGISLFVVLLMVAWARWVIRSLTREITESINILEETANDLLFTATEVSTGATETATSVAETTTTIEEVRQTSLLSNQKAMKVLENSQKASDVAENGKLSVMKTIEGMQRIKTQMELIAQSIVKLADQSRVIGDITTTVNDLADQSNLLAVNASIEAAKAGEQGRGFAVVAQEIRSLSEQSKKSTAQVKEILNDIQKSVSHTVLATEQGTKAVESGSTLANESGKVIELLFETVEEAAQSAFQISSSTNEQMAGMDQIVPAMEHIKLASKQNAEGTKKTQTVAKNLGHLGDILKDTIRKFNV